jgi:hypothetical protein
MPMDLRRLVKLLKSHGYTVERTQKGHYAVIDSRGDGVCTFAAGHGKTSKRDEIKDPYLRQIQRLTGIRF